MNEEQRSEAKQIAEFAGAFKPIGALAGDAPILLRTSDTSGHGLDTALSEEIDEYTDVLSFLYHQLNVTPE